MKTNKRSLIVVDLAKLNNKDKVVETIELPGNILSIEVFKFDNNTNNVNFNKLALLVEHSSDTINNKE
mgnify:CR=1 FL=1